MSDYNHVRGGDPPPGTPGSFISDMGKVGGSIFSCFQEMQNFLQVLLPEMQAESDYVSELADIASAQAKAGQDILDTDVKNIKDEQASKDHDDVKSSKVQVFLAQMNEHSTMNNTINQNNQTANSGSAAQVQQLSSGYSETCTKMSTIVGIYQSITSILQGMS